MITKSVQNALEHSEEDTKRMAATRRRLNNLANRVLHIPKAPVQRMVKDLDPRARRAAKMSLASVAAEVESENITLAKREQLFESLVPPPDPTSSAEVVSAVRPGSARAVSPDQVSDRKRRAMHPKTGLRDGGDLVAEASVGNVNSSSAVRARMFSCVDVLPDEQLESGGDDDDDDDASSSSSKRKRSSAVSFFDGSSGGDDGRCRFFEDDDDEGSRNHRQLEGQQEHASPVNNDQTFGRLFRSSSSSGRPIPLGQLRRERTVVSGIFSRPKGEDRKKVAVASDDRLKHVEIVWNLPDEKKLQLAEKHEQELLQLPPVKLRSVVEFEKQAARDARELAVTFTEHYLRVENGSARPLTSAFSRMASQKDARMPATSWHVDFCVKEPEAKTWRWFTKRFYEQANNTGPVLLNSITFSGSCDGFNVKDLKVPDPELLLLTGDDDDVNNNDPSGGNTLHNHHQHHRGTTPSAVVQLDDELPMSLQQMDMGTSLLLFSSAATGANDDGENDASSSSAGGRSHRRSASPFASSKLSSKRRSLSGPPTARTAAMQQQGNSSISSPTATATGTSSPPKTNKALERFRRRKSLAANAELQQRLQQHSLQNDDEDPDHLPRRTLLLNLTFLQCKLDRSAEFFRRMRDEPRVKIEAISIEHCKLPRVDDNGPFDDEEDQDRRSSNSRSDDNDDGDDGNSAFRGFRFCGNSSADVTGDTTTSAAPAPPGILVVTPENSSEAAGGGNGANRDGHHASSSPRGGSSSLRLLVPSSPASSMKKRKRSATPNYVAFSDSPVLQLPSSLSCSATASSNQRAKKNKKKASVVSEQSVNSESSKSRRQHISFRDDDLEHHEEPEEDVSEFTDAFLNYLSDQASTLTKISLHGTRLSGDFLKKFATLLRSKTLNKLTHLDLGLTGLESVDDSEKNPMLPRTIASAIAHCPSLELLSLAGTAFSPPHVGIAFCAAIRANTSIRTVICDGCDRSGTKFQTIIHQMLEERDRAVAELEEESRRRRRILEVLSGSFNKGDDDDTNNNSSDDRGGKHQVASFDAAIAAAQDGVGGVSSAAAMTEVSGAFDDADWSSSELLTLQPSKSVCIIDEVVL